MRNEHTKPYAGKLSGIEIIIQEAAAEASEIQPKAHLRSGGLTIAVFEPLQSRVSQILKIRLSLPDLERVVVGRLILLMRRG